MSIHEDKHLSRRLFLGGGWEVPTVAYVASRCLSLQRLEIGTRLASSDGSGRLRPCVTARRLLIVVMCEISGARVSEYRGAYASCCAFCWQGVGVLACWFVVGCEGRFWPSSFCWREADDSSIDGFAFEASSV
jgi:hypothetical protein